MTTLFMLDDVERWPDDPTPGVLCSPTTYWLDDAKMGLPREVVSEVVASIIPVQVDGGVERVAHIGDEFTTLLGTGEAPVGEAVLTGCLVWDRYLWTTYRTPPSGQVRVLNFAGCVVQRVTRHPTAHPGWFTPEPYGPLDYRPAGHLDPGTMVKWRVWRVRILQSHDPFGGPC
jgi:hypothetical protein